MKRSFDEACQRLRSLYQMRGVEPEQWDYVLARAKCKIESLKSLVPVIGVRSLEWIEDSGHVVAVVVVQVGTLKIGRNSNT